MPYNLYLSLCIFVLAVSHFGFEGKTLVLIELVPDHFFSFTFYEFIISVGKRQSSGVHMLLCGCCSIDSPLIRDAFVCIDQNQIRLV